MYWVMAICVAFSPWLLHSWGGRRWRQAYAGMTSVGMSRFGVRGASVAAVLYLLSLAMKQ